MGLDFIFQETPDSKSLTDHVSWQDCFSNKFQKNINFRLKKVQGGAS
jgi:hypothetical protein